MFEEMSKEFQSMKNDIDWMKRRILQLEAEKGLGIIEDNELLDLDGLSAYLKIPKSTLYNTYKGKIRSCKIGRKVMFKKKDVDDYIFSRTTKTAREIAIEINTQQKCRAIRRN